MRTAYYSDFPFFPGTQIIKLAVLVVVVLLVGHLFLGASVLVVTAAFVTILFGVLPVARYGTLNLAGLLLTLVAFRHIGFPIVGKLMMGQSLDSNLEHPGGAFLAVLLGMCGYFVALTLAAKIGVGKPLLSRVIDDRQLRIVSAVAAVVGVTANLALAVRISEDYEGVTVANFFVSFLHLALIAGVAARLVRTGGKRSIDFWVIVVLASEIVFALVMNSRMALLDTFLSYVITRVAFGGRMSSRWLGGMLGLGLVAIMLITPVMLYVRDVRGDLSWTERVEMTLSVIKNWREASAAYEAWRDLSAEKSYLQYYGAPQNVFERMSLVNHVDVLKSGIDRTRQVGFEDLGSAIEKAVPRFLAPEKPRGFSQGEWLYCEAGVDCFEGGYATAPLIATGYASFGWVGAMTYPLLLGFSVLLITKKLVGWNLNENVFAIYMLFRVHNNFVEGSSDANVVMILRDLPQDLLILLFISATAGVIRYGMRSQRKVA